ncbi:UNVERIFIED_CONTAM: hypothetical protein FKN15_055071 [Acipenser sinensis]
MVTTKTGTALTVISVCRITEQAESGFIIKMNRELQGVCEPAWGALKLGYLTQELIDGCDPLLMFTIPRLAIIWDLLCILTAEELDILEMNLCTAESGGFLCQQERSPPSTGSGGSPYPDELPPADYEPEPGKLEAHRAHRAPEPLQDLYTASSTVATASSSSSSSQHREDLLCPLFTPRDPYPSLRTAESSPGLQPLLHVSHRRGNHAVLMKKRKQTFCSSKLFKHKTILKRTVHNELEKHRRAQLRHCLEQLKQQVPLSAESSRNTTLNLLRRARLHIKKLQEQDKRAERMKDRLRWEQSGLRGRLEQLLGGTERTRNDSLGSALSSERSDSDQEDVEVDVESTVFVCVETEGLGDTQGEGDHSYSSPGLVWL